MMIMTTMKYKNHYTVDNRSVARLLKLHPEEFKYLPTPARSQENSCVSVFLIKFYANTV